MSRPWVVLLVLAAVPAGGEPPRRALTEALGGSVNTLGIQQTLEASWTWPLGRSSHPLRKDTSFALGLTNHVSPAYVRLGGWAAFSPLSVLELRAGVEPAYYFGILGSLIGFPTQRAVFDEDARRALRPQAVSGKGVRLYFAPTLRARVGRVVASGTFDLERWDVDGPGPFFYEPLRDTVLASHGDSLWRTSTIVVRESLGKDGRKLLAGLHHEFMRVRRAPENDMHRLGPLAIWTLGHRRFGVHDPTLLVNVYYYLEDPYKRHEPGAAVSVRFGFGR
ncbi:MAG TPA: hypothetical protein VMT87_09675 [Vicinamibacteria bacterium]|nr:hypothetical protein [Vicinamibacteria bacterium]